MWSPKFKPFRSISVLLKFRCSNTVNWATFLSSRIGFRRNSTFTETWISVANVMFRACSSPHSFKLLPASIFLSVAFLKFVMYKAGKSANHETCFQNVNTHLWSPRAYLEGGTGPPPPQSKTFFALFKYSLSWFLPKHVYNLCRTAWKLWHLCMTWQTLCVSH